MVVALTERHWRHLVELTGVGEAIDALERSLGVDLHAEEVRYRYRQVLAALIAPWFEARSTEEVRKGLEASKVLWGPYRTVEQLVRDPDSLLAISGLFTDVNHPGIGSFPTPRTVLSGAGPLGPPAPAHLVGADTRAVLTDWLGLGADEVRGLRASGAVGGAEE